MEERRFITHEQANAVKPEKILRLFQTDLGRRILNAGKVRREFKYSVLAPGRIVDPAWGEEKILFQGVVDCCLEEADCLTVIDFKTDRVTLQTMAERAQAYRPQLDAYAYALERITGKPVREKYLYFFETARAVLM
jgi:ATP-dependent helicase/nuclease subunit A